MRCVSLNNKNTNMACYFILTIGQAVSITKRKSPQTVTVTKNKLCDENHTEIDKVLRSRAYWPKCLQGNQFIFVQERFLSARSAFNETVTLITFIQRVRSNQGRPSP